MNATIEFQKPPQSNEIIVRHRYDASVETLWDAFTKTEMLEKWWAPQPYKAVVQHNDFEEGKSMKYYMISPEGEKHYCITEFHKITPYKSYEMTDAFCDEHGVINEALPQMRWENVFSEQNGVTTVTNTLHFASEEDRKQLMEMGFEQGYTTALNQLADLLAKK